MPASPRISNGECAIYGRERRDEIQNVTLWRNRLHNEKAGMPGTDVSGANTSVSLLWCPNRSDDAVYGQYSRKRASDLKQVQDFGRRTGSAASSSSVAPAAAAEAPPPPMPRAGRYPSLEAPVPPSSSAASFLNVEDNRLQAAAHARSLGQTFLRAGNLTQARLHLQRAEKLLQVDQAHKAKPADEMSDHYKKDTFR